MEKSKLITVYPIVSGNGAKFVATNIAHFLKTEHPKKKVALVDFNLKQPYLAHSLSSEDVVHGLDNIIDNIEANILTDTLFIENMIVLKNKVELLKGTTLIGKHKMFNENHMQTIINQLKKHYDYVVLAVSPEMDNAGTVYGVHEADEIILVARNNIANEKLIPIRLNAIKQYKKTLNKLKLVYNMNTTASTSTALSVFVNTNNIDVVGLIDYDTKAIDNVDLMMNSSVKLFSRNKNHTVFSSIANSL